MINLTNFPVDFDNDFFRKQKHFTKVSLETVNSKFACVF